MTAPQQTAPPKGYLFVTTHGSIREETTMSLLALQQRLLTQGIPCEIRCITGNLVDKARNDAVHSMLTDRDAAYLIFLDADMVWNPDLVEHLLVTAYRECPWADVVGGWCPLRGRPYLPTIDTGTGTWEPTLPGQGPLEVIRTGGACVLVKRHVFERMEFPWYGVRVAPRAIDTLAEFDNYCRIKFNGQNPFAKHTEWQQVLGCAQQDALSQRQADPVGAYGAWNSSVGEDSNFADKARALGFRIVVQTNAVCGHVDKHVISPTDHMKAFKEQEEQELLACGVLP